ncbi:MAG: competence/damage-inducible protein A [Armatimonadetes bacterium]|nr:competence/damage-inducible protein A [Armatimonadota bacterium]
MVRAEIISVGTELLLGQITDTNATHICQRLAEAGVAVFYRQTVGDNQARVQEAFRNAWQRADLVLFTGGLGPTEDDLTKESVAAELGVPMVEHQASMRHLEAYFARRNRTLTPNQRRQAMLPEGADPIPNALGSAPGVLWNRDGRIIAMVPGVPREMRGMVDEAILPALRARGWIADEVIRSRVVRTIGVGEGALEDQIKDLLKTSNPTIAPLVHQGEVHLRVTGRGKPGEVDRLLDAGERLLRDRLGDVVYGLDTTTLEGAIGVLLAASGKTVAVAESCTGGLIGHRLTRIAGSSAYFLGGVVAYANDVKSDMLGVPKETLAAHGAVSSETAEAMARGVRERLGADYGLSVTGIAGPGGGTDEKPVGLVYLSLANGGGVRIVRQDYGTEPGREGIKYNASQAALNLLRRALLERKPS